MRAMARSIEIDPDEVRGKTIINEEEIERIIKSVKSIPFERKDFKLTPENKHLRSDVKLEGEYETYMNIRVSAKDSSNFSVLLRYKSVSGSAYIITRYNGFHGNHENPDGSIFSGCHIHRITERAQRDGLKEEAQASLTTKYNTWRKAVEVFMSDMSIYFKGEENNTKLEEWLL
ncbi:MAG: hypothetical protein EOM93_05355 [Gammaproteobacteria bacterium]|nr:hypothetical protein [Gammaproteobacteria bacterium]